MNEEEIEKRFEEIEKRFEKLETSKMKKELITPPKGLSIKEFILEKNPNSDVQRTLCIAYYLEKFQNKERFISKDLVGLFKKAKLVAPKNISDKIYKCIKRGLMVEDKEKEYYLTGSGEKIVENNFEKKK